MGRETGRLTAHEIFDRVEAGAQDELERPLDDLAFSALSAGLAMGISALGVAVLLHAGAGETVAYLGYPLGFLIVILGRMQLFTENTLFPVALVLGQRRYLLRTARLWAIVLVANLVGTLLFAALVTTTPALGAGVTSELVQLGVTNGSESFGRVFWSAVVAGWIIALVAWLVTASTDTAGQIVVVFLLTFAVGAAHLAHSIAGSSEVLAAVLDGQLPWTSYGSWLAAAVLGNIVGGALIVALLNYGQVESKRKREKPDAAG